MTNVLNFRDYKPVVELSNDELVAKCSSIGAIQPSPKTSSKYSFIPTIKAVNYLRDAGFTPIEARQGKPRLIEKAGFQQHVIKFTNPDFDLGDRRIELNLYNSHDAGSAYILTGGLYRLICSNGMVVGSNLAEFRHRHMGFNPDLFIESAKFVADNMKRITARVQDWEQIELTPNEQGIFAEAAHEIMYEGKTHISTKPDQLLTIRRTQDTPSNLWTTFNRIQENVIKGGLPGRAKSGRRSKTRGVTNIKRDKRLNQSMWGMAEHIAQVKLAA
jgi:hypothetical protein